jgi:hypothetical protein
LPGLRVPGDQRQPQSLPSHLVEVLPFGDGAQNVGDNSGTQIFVVYLNCISYPLPVLSYDMLGCLIFCDMCHKKSLYASLVDTCIGDVFRRKLQYQHLIAICICRWLSQKFLNICT